MSTRYSLITAAAVLALSALPAAAQPGGQQNQDTSMSFFITSVGSGNGADLGGLAGADAHCQMLAEAAGSTGKTWRAYLSTADEDARDRIGDGPWFNASGQMVARGVDDLHYSNTMFIKENLQTENGDVPNGVGDQPNQHDILTGTNPDGTFSGMNCNNWSHSGGDYQATVGHFDRVGGGPMANSWNAAHVSRGCSQENLQASGGNGYFYCFAE